MVTSALMINLRLLGVRATDQPLVAVARRFLPFARAARVITDKQRGKDKIVAFHGVLPEDI